MSRVAFLAAAPPYRSPAACQRCVSGWRRRSAAAGPRTSSQLAGCGWRVRLPGQPWVTRPTVSPSSGRWHMAAGPSDGEQDAAPSGGADDGVDVDMELLRKRMKEVQAEAEGDDEDEDEDNIAFVAEAIVDEVHVPVKNNEDIMLMLEMVSGGDSDSDSASDHSDDRDDDDDGDESQGDGPSVSRRLRRPNSLEKKELEMAYKDCSSLFIILLKAEEDGNGLYSVEVGGHDVVLAFARVEEAGRYARALKDKWIIDIESIVDISIAELVPSELEEFCSDAGVGLGFVPVDAWLSPEHLHASNIATVSPFSSSPPDPLRDGGMAEGEADALREKLNKLLGKDGGDA